MSYRKGTHLPGIFKKQPLHRFEYCRACILHCHGNTRSGMLFSASEITSYFLKIEHTPFISLSSLALAKHSGPYLLSLEDWFNLWYRPIFGARRQISSDYSPRCLVLLGRHSGPYLLVNMSSSVFHCWNHDSLWGEACHQIKILEQR